MKANEAGFKRLLRWGMSHKVEFLDDGFTAKRCLICNWEPSPDAYSWAMQGHISDHIENNELTEKMMLTCWIS